MIEHQQWLKQTSTLFFFRVSSWAFLSGAEKIPKLLKRSSVRVFYESRDFAGDPAVWDPEVPAKFHGNEKLESPSHQYTHGVSLALSRREAHEVLSLITKKTQGTKQTQRNTSGDSARQNSLPRTSQDSFLAKIPALTLTATWLSGFCWDHDASHCQRKGLCKAAGALIPCWTLDPLNDPTHRTTRQACHLQSAPPLEKHAIFQR